MDPVTIIIFAFLIIGLIGLLFGIGLAFASKKLHVPVDEKIEKLEAILPHVNCGACGYPGCMQYAEAIIKNGAAPDLCAPGGQSTLDDISRILGIETAVKEKMIAVVRCQGGHAEARRYGPYTGPKDCWAASLTGGNKVCSYGCLGYGTCVTVCKFNAIYMNENGLPVVIEEKCTGCNKCVEACPRDIITLMPAQRTYQVIACISKDKGGVTRKYCTVGCTGCKICEKAVDGNGCQVIDNCAVVDPNTFTGDAAGYKKCPQGTIQFDFDKYQQLIADGTITPPQPVE